jgi:Domain of unknown function (DUF6894)
MNRYFFDVVGHDQSELDYAGRMLPTAEEAYDAAEMMAFDLAVKRSDEMAGFAVSVSNADGRKLFAIPIKESSLTAMPAELSVGEPTIRREREASASHHAAVPRVDLDGKIRKMAA